MIVQFEEEGIGHRLVVNTDNILYCVSADRYRTKIFFSERVYVLVKSSIEEVHARIGGSRDTGIKVTRRGGQKRTYVGFEERKR